MILHVNAATRCCVCQALDAAKDQLRYEHQGQRGMIVQRDKKRQRVKVVFGDRSKLWWTAVSLSEAEDFTWCHLNLAVRVKPVEVLKGLKVQ